MAVSNELPKPDTEDEFEAMCHQLYKKMWQDVGCVRVGRGGQSQFGVDVIGSYNGARVGVQCKHYNKKAFVLSTVTGDIEKADDVDLSIDHLLFATTAGSDPNLIEKIQQLSEQRRKDGKFTVSVDFWGDICGHLRMYPEVGRSFIRSFPGSVALATLETSLEILSASQSMQASTDTQHSILVAITQDTNDKISALSNQLLSPEAKGDEADPVVVAKLDLVRDSLREGRTKDASRILSELGDPDSFRDQFSKFRWYTNSSSIELEEGRVKPAAEGYLQAFAFAKDNETAAANRAHAFLLLKDAESALRACDEGLSRFKESTHLWAVKVHALQMLGYEEPESGIPESIRESDELLFSRARLASRKKNYSRAIELLRECLDSDGGSFEAKRSLLVEALEWAGQDPVRASSSHFSAEKKDALRDAVQRLEPLEQTLSFIQSDSTSEEVVSNVVNALYLLGDSDRAQRISSIFLPKHPLAEALLRVKILQLAQEKDTQSIRKMTDGLIEKLQLPVLAILAEVSATDGNVQWHDDIQKSIEKIEDDQSRLKDIGVLRFQAKWVSGDKSGAIDGIYSHVKANPTHVLGRIAFAHFLVRENKNAEAMDQALACIDLVKSNDSVFEKLQLAELLFRLRDYESAAKLYESIVDHPGADDLTANLLISLIETDQRRKAQGILDGLSLSDRQDLRIRRIECNLARRMSDWTRLRELLSLEIARVPDSAEIAVAYAGTLYRIGDVEALHTYLRSDPTFKKSSPESEFEFAKHQLDAGYTALAIGRLYRLYRNNSDSTKIAGFYLSQLLLAPITDELQAPETVGVGSAVKLQGDSNCWWVLIDEVGASGAWPELVANDAAIASQLIGKRRGEIVSVSRGFTTQPVEVVEIKSSFAFAADKAHERLAASASQEGPLWTFSAYKPDGQLDIETISSTARERRQLVETAFDSYRKHRFPLCFLARLVGTDVVSLILDWPFSEFDLYVGTGTHEERDSSIAVIESDKKRYVLDLTAITELTRNDLFDSVVQVVGTPLVAQSVRDELVNTIHFHRKQTPTATVSEKDGKLSVFEVNPRHYGRRISLLEKILANIDGCEICPTIGPEQIDESFRKLASVLDDHAVDSLYLCVERNAALIAEDGGLRQIARGLGVGDVAWVQPLLMVALAKGCISVEKYAKAIADMIMSGRDFVSVRADDLTHLARSEPSRLSPKVKAMLDTCRRSTVDLRSAIEVALEFLQFAAVKLPVRIAAGYACHIRDVLSDGRPDLRERVSDVISLRLQVIYGRNGRRVKIYERKYFEGLLKRRPIQ